MSNYSFFMKTFEDQRDFKRQAIIIFLPVKPALPLFFYAMKLESIRGRP